VIAGGFAPLIFGALYRAYRSTLWLSIYASVALAVTVVALSRARTGNDM
jgi:hypothetical protein